MEQKEELDWTYSKGDGNGHVLDETYGDMKRNET